MKKIRLIIYFIDELKDNVEVLDLYPTPRVSFEFDWLYLNKILNMLSEQEQIRREKLNKLKSLGINPFPSNLYPVNNNSLEITSNFKEDKDVVVAGRLMSRRIQGKASFAEIQDSKGKIQV